MEAKQPVITSRLPIARNVLLAALSLLMLTLGCSRGPKPPQCRVTGKVLVGGAPAGELCLRFHSISHPEKALLPEGTWTEPDGSFVLPIQDPGDYVITAIWPTVEVVQGERVEGADRLLGRLSSQQNSQIKKTIVAGENTLPALELFPQ